MSRILAATLTLALSAPVQAQMLDGADDPAFRDAVTALLAADDAAAVDTLRALAEAGNPAALATLPFALQWVPPQGTLKEKNAQRMVGGIKAQDAAAEAHGATALWNTGLADGPDPLPDRAAGLLTFGEAEKAAYLMFLWVNQTGGLGDLPPVLLSDDTPATVGAYALSWRMLDAAYTNGPVQDEFGRLLALMKDDRLVGWTAYVQILASDPAIFGTVGDPLPAVGLPDETIEARLEDARAVVAVSPIAARDETPTPAATALRARDALQGRAELLPVTHLCQAHCPDSLAACEAAVLAYPGQLFGSFEAIQPFATTLDPVAFAASDRGLAALIAPRTDPAAAADRATAEGLDACYAGVLAHRDTLAFGP